MALTDEQKVMRNSTGMRIADALEHIASNINDTYVYGFIEDMSILDPEDRITYFGEAASFDPMTRNADGTMSEGGWGRQAGQSPVDGQVGRHTGLQVG